MIAKADSSQKLDLLFKIDMNITLKLRVIKISLVIKILDNFY